MVSMKVQVISKEAIKPSSPTPHHLRSFKLSLFDQFTPPVYVPIILFYPTNVGDGVFEDVQRSDRLKKSLSETLTRFYPVAGRIKDNFSVDCNDEGVDYSEARVEGHLSQLLKRPEVEVLNQLLPFTIHNAGSCAGDVQLAIQINIFDCGGLVIGMCFSHKIADGSTISTFINGWAATARGSSEEVRPTFDSAFLFPPRDSAGFKPNAGITGEKMVTKRFVFHASKIAALKAKATERSGSVQPTRVEVVSALVWKCVMGEPKSSVVYVANHAVNLRGRMLPPLPDHSFGNLFQMTIAPMVMEKRTELHSLVGHLRDAMKKINPDYISKLQGENGMSFFNEYFNEIRVLFCKGEVQFCRFSSWCRFPLYEADFGWGKPVWVSSAGIAFKNTVFLIDTRWGDGIETWVTMEEKDMAKFESDPELLAFVSST